MCKLFITEDVYFAGYNNIHYDNPIINYCIEFSLILSTRIVKYVDLYSIYQMLLHKTKIILIVGNVGNTLKIF